MFTLIWSHQAESDYIDILEYWMNHNKSNKYSTKLIDEVEKKEKLISKNPNIGSLSEIEGVRYILIDKNFSLYYRINDDVIEILAFWDNRRDPDSLSLEYKKKP
ncbi:Plasmid stabilization system protein ParE [Chryseobacterium taichungense]|uniref:Plasmid stabilization system protein ParE n=1 Tax=Chryseobacterium taichungense TaxID=295069 RepID=A0A1H7VVA2_9FLAO|nr:type II toxin-antitoxin system RelE/ParE family toxin [Chryseobacterium taichungense]SEM12727.1 Plasmid stabilization system protein ParE [Chryseobacterium taichungense]